MAQVTDPWGNELFIGEEVCSVRRTGRYLQEMFGTITGFSPAGYARVLVKEGGEYLCKERIFKKPTLCDG